MQLSTLTNLEHWGVTAFQPQQLLPQQLLAKFTKLRLWNLHRPESEIAPILKLMTNLDTLNFIDESQTWPFALIAHPEKLTSIYFCLTQPQVNGSEMWSRLTNLKSLSINNEPDINNTIELAYLTALDYCELVSKTLPSFETNTNLTYLTLACYEWPATNAQSLKKVTKLRRLDIMILPEQDLESFQFLADLRSLKKLVIRMTSEYDPPIYDMGSKVYAHIPSTLRTLVPGLGFKFSDLTHLVNLNKLTLEHHVVTWDYRPLSYLSNLTTLVIQTLTESSALREIAKLTNLEKLRIVNSHRDVTVNEVKNMEAFVPNLSQLTHLKLLHVDLRGCPSKILFQALKNLPNLENLFFPPGVSKDSNEHCSFLSALTKLTKFVVWSSIRNPDWNDEWIWPYLRYLPNLEYLVIDQMDSEDKIQDLLPLDKLTYLLVARGPQTSDDIGNRFASLTSLNEPYLSNKTVDLRSKTKK